MLHAYEIVSPLLACCLIALDKCPSVRPIGIGYTSRRIMLKAIFKVAKGEIQEATGSKQLCGVDAAIYTARECLIDARNVFNSLNRHVALHDIQFTCPELSTVLHHTYRAPSDLYIDGELIYYYYLLFISRGIRWPCLGNNPFLTSCLEI